MITIETFLMLSAFVCFVVAFIGGGKFNFIALGLALWVLTILI